MPKSQPSSEMVRQRAIIAVAAAWEAGCPVAGSRPELQAEIADVFLRHYRSLIQQGISDDQRPKQIQELAYGLAKWVGGDRQLVGALMHDYEWLANQVLATIVENGD